MNNKFKRTPYALDRDGKDLLVRADAACIEFLCLLIDGVALIFFGKSKVPYLRVLDAIAWHEKELEESRGRCGNRRALELLKDAQAKFEAGNVVEEGKGDRK